MKLRLPNFGLTERLKDWVTGARDNDAVNMVLYDRTLLWLTFGLAIIGFVMVTSASMPIGQRTADDPFLFAKRDALYLGLAFGLSLVTLRVPMEIWQRYSNVMLLMSIVMLLIVLVVGSSVNGLRAGSRSARCVFSRQSCPSCRCFATWRAIWCARWKRCAATSGASASRWA